MPALVVWERLIVAGDDLRLGASFLFIMRCIQIAIAIPVLYFTIDYGKNPLLFKPCVKDENEYNMWLTSAYVTCALTLLYGIVGAAIELAICRVSGRGTPTETELRRNLVPLCKCNILPMFIVRLIGFVAALSLMVAADNYCSCLRSYIPDISRRQCPSHSGWFICVRVLVFSMACDVVIPAVTFLVIMRRRIYRYYERLRPPSPRGMEEVEESWKRACRRLCECSSFLTCYMFGGRRLSTGNYADVAIALTDFLGDGGSLDIVPSDIAAALICLVSIQKEKHIECRNQLMSEGGLYAKDKALVAKLWKMFTDSAFSKKEDTRDQKMSAASSQTVSKNEPENILLADVLSIPSFVRIDSSNDCVDIESGFNIPVEQTGSGRLPAGLMTRPADDDYRPKPSHDSSQRSLLDERVEEKSHRNRNHSAPTVSSFDLDLSLPRLFSHSDFGKSFEEAISVRLVHSNSAIFFEPTIRRVLSPNNYFDRLVLAEGAHYCRVALAAYSWMLYVWTHRCTGFCELMGNWACGVVTCHPRYCKKNRNIIGDNICGWKQTTVLKSMGIDDSDILYANFKNAVGVNPYMILVDRSWSTVVLAIRGTLSFEDMISDVTINPETLEDLGEEFGFDGRGQYCHNGILTGAKWIYEDLKRHKILDEILLHSERYRGFNLRVIGHSLGAGIAAMLGLMLRKSFPMLRCLCFSPPGCVFSNRIAEEGKEYMWSYVLHHDVVPRLSYDSLVNFRNDLIEMIARIKVPKHEVFDTFIAPASEQSLLNRQSKLLHRKNSIPESQFWKDFEGYKERQDRRNAQRNIERKRVECKMTIPGRIVQLVRTSVKHGNFMPCNCFLSCLKCVALCGLSNETKKYKVRWNEAEDFSEIYISPSMLIDHFPYNIARALEAAAASYDIKLDSRREEFDDNVNFSTRDQRKMNAENKEAG